MKAKFTRAEIRAVLIAAGMESSHARKAVARIIDAMAAALAAGEVIELRGLGTLEPRERKARVMRNPRTMAPLDVPARRGVFFRPSGKLMEAINKDAGFIPARPGEETSKKEAAV